MNKDPARLNFAQDSVFHNGDFWPKETDDGEVTYCNLAVQSVLSYLGYTGLAGLTADQMYYEIIKSPDWLIKPIAECQGLANEGVIVLGILPAVKLNQPHGHVNTLTTGLPEFSGHWNLKAPLCMNLGRSGTCFRAKGESWAFETMPEFYALKATL